MTLLGTIRPDEWNFPLLVHVLGALVLVGGLLAGAVMLAYARGDARYLRLGYWTLLAVALPGWVVMRVGAQWIYSKEGWDDLPAAADEPAWLGLGWVFGDLGGAVLLVSLIVGGLGLYRLRAGSGVGLLKATLVLSLLLLAANVIAVWAMTGKPD